MVFGDIRYSLFLARNNRLAELHCFTVDGAARLAPRCQREYVTPRHLAEDVGMRAFAAKFDDIGETQLLDQAVELGTLRAGADDAT